MTLLTQAHVAPEQVMPYDADAEQSMVGALLVEPQNVSLVRSIIDDPTDIFIQSTRAVWEAICSLDDKHMPIDIVTVAEEMERLGSLHEYGGRAYITELCGGTFYTYNVEGYARLVHDHGVRRRMLYSLQRAARIAFDESKDADSIVGEVVQEVTSAAGSALVRTVQTAQSVSAEIVRDAYDRAGGALPGIATGLTDFDALLGGGLQNEDFVIVAGRPGKGKTGFLLTAARHAAKAFHVGYFSLEMSAKQNITRLLAHEMGDVDYQRIRAGRLSDNEWQSLDIATRKIEALKLWIDDTPALTPAQLRAKALQKRAEGKLDLLIVDYAGLMQGEGKTIYERMTNVSSGLKKLARELKIPVFVAQQLNRGVEEHSNDKPLLSDLKDTGAFEQDADVVCLLWDDTEHADIMGGGKMQPMYLSVAKHRNGATGDLPVARVKKTTEFVQLTRREI